MTILENLFVKGPMITHQCILLNFVPRKFPYIHTLYLCVDIYIHTYAMVFVQYNNYYIIGI